MKMSSKPGRPKGKKSKDNGPPPAQVVSDNNIQEVEYVDQGRFFLPSSTSSGPLSDSASLSLYPTSTTSPVPPREDAFEWETCSSRFDMMSLDDNVVFNVTSSRCFFT